jgi:hypothetical protein
MGDPKIVGQQFRSIGPVCVCVLVTVKRGGSTFPCFFNRPATSRVM